MEFIDPATLSNQKPQRSLCLHFPLAGIAGLYHRTWLYCMGSELGSSNLSSKHLATCAPPGLHISLGPHKCRAFEEFEAFSVRSPHGCSTSRRLGKAAVTWPLLPRQPLKDRRLCVSQFRGQHFCLCCNSPTLVRALLPLDRLLFSYMSSLTCTN